MNGRFAALQQRDFRVLWIGALFSFMGVQMQFFLRGILAWDLTERADALGLVYFVLGVSLLVATPLGGVASDRFPKRTLMLVSQSGTFVAPLLLSIAVLADVVAYWMLVGSAVLQGTAFGFFGPARVAMARDLVGRENLGNAIGLQSLAMNGTRTLAPSLAGALVGWSAFGIGPTYIVATLLAVGAMIATALLPNPPAVLGGAARPVADIMAGIRYVRATPEIRGVVAATFAVLMFAFSYVSFIPALVEGEFGLEEQHVGYFTSAGSVGALLAGLWVAGVADSPRAPWIMAVAGMLFGLSVVGLGLAPSFGVAVAIVAFAGASTTTFQTLSNTLALQAAADEFGGRVQSILQLGFAGFGMAALPLGVLAERIGLRTALVIMGSIAAAAVGRWALMTGAVQIRQSRDARV